jgi:hypothetical protein
MDAGMTVNAIAIAISIIALAASSFIAISQLRTSRSANLALVTLEHLTRETRTDDFMESEDFVLCRLNSEHSPDAGIYGLPKEARKHVQRIGQYYAGLGIVSVFRATEGALLLGAIHWRVQVAWSALEPYVRAERAIRNNQYLSYFEHLACLAHDVDKAEVLSKQKIRRATGKERFASLSGHAKEALSSSGTAPRGPGK